MLCGVFDAGAQGHPIGLLSEKEQPDNEPVERELFNRGDREEEEALRRIEKTEEILDSPHHHPFRPGRQRLHQRIEHQAPQETRFHQKGQEINRSLRHGWDQEAESQESGGERVLG